MFTAIPLNYWFFLTWNCLACLIIVIGTVAMEYRRNIQPVKARDRGLSLLTNLGYLSGTLLRATITTRPDLSCLYDIWQAPITIGFLSSIYLLRSWRMYFKFELAHERSLLRSSDTKKNSEETGHRRSVSVTASALAKAGTRGAWFSEHRYLISQKFTFAFTFISILIFFVPNVIDSIRGHYTDVEAGDSVNCKIASIMTFWQTGMGLLYLLGLLILAVKLRKTFDAFGIKHELKMVFWLNVLSWTIVTSLAVLTSDKFNTTVFNFRKLAPLVFMMLLFIQTTAIPVWKTFEESNQSLEVAATGNANDINTLTGLLKSPEGFAAFQQYLIGCFCVESCLFWKEIEEYRAQVLMSLRQASQKKSKRLADLEFLLNRAKEINVVYIKEESRLQVNISSSQRQRVEHAVNNLMVKYEPMLQQHLETHDSGSSPNEIAIPISGHVRTSLVGLLNSPGSGDDSNPAPVSPRPSADTAPPPASDDETTGDSKPSDESTINPELKEKFKDILNVFNIAQLEVIELMRTDPYPRFRVTKQFQELIQQSQLKQHRIEALRDLNII